MKHNKKYNIFGWLAATAFMLTTACSDNIAIEAPQGDANGKLVTFTIMPQTQELGTRAEGDIDTRNTYISDGTKADVLIFAVYKQQADGTWKPDKTFSKGNQTDNYTQELGPAQNAINVKKFPVAIQLYITDPDAKYKVAFWAQNHGTEAYNTKDLENVTVNYDKAKNNDELRDAFCVVTKEDIDYYTSSSQVVTLRRPLAQVNVGTAGRDYEGAACLKPSKVSYTESSITLSGVAQHYNVLEETILDTKEELTDVTFDFGLLPAFIQNDNEEWKLQYTPVTNEEFLQVDVNRNGEIDGYTSTKYPKTPTHYVGWDLYQHYLSDTTLSVDDPEETDEDGEPKQISTKELFEKYDKLPETEKYKYLSMCYVLVPEATKTTVTGADGTEAEEESSVLNSVTFQARGIEPIDADAPSTIDDGDATDDDTADATDNTLKTVFTINNVPVRKNWRTNIVGNNFFTTTHKFYLDIVPEYCGNYNYNGLDDDYESPDQGESWKGKKYTYTLTFGSNGSIENTDDPDFENKNFFSKSQANEVNQTRFSPNDDPAIYDGKTLSWAKKMNSSSKIDFTLPCRATVLIVMSTKINADNVIIDGHGALAINGDEQSSSLATTPEGSKNIEIYNLSLPQGSYTITNPIKGAEYGIFLIEVQTDDNTIYPSIFGKDDDGNDNFYKEYPDYKE